MKRCARCESTLDESLFYFRLGKPSSYCKKCTQEYATKRNKEHPEGKLAINRRWRRRHLERVKIMNKASLAVFYAIKRGDLVRSDKCNRCQKEGYTEGAHHDYSKPLEVEWLCRSCHRLYDKGDPKSINQKQNLPPE